MEKSRIDSLEVNNASGGQYMVLNIDDHKYTIFPNKIITVHHLPPEGLGELKIHFIKPGEVRHFLLENLTRK